MGRPELDRRPAATKRRGKGWRATVYGLCLRSGCGGSQGCCGRATSNGSCLDACGVAMTSVPTLSVNQRSAALVARMIGDAEELRIGVACGALCATLIQPGS